MSKPDPIRELSGSFCHNVVVCSLLLAALFYTYVFIHTLLGLGGTDPHLFLIVQCSLILIVSTFCI